MSTGSRAFSNEIPNVPHLIRGKEVGDLRDDVEAAFYRVEKRTGYPKISRVVGGTAVSISGLPASADLAGTGFLQGQTKATATIGTGTAELAFTATRPGEPGNDITVEIVDSAGGGLAVSVVGTDIEIDKGGASDDADAIKVALDGDADIANLIVTVSGGAGVPVVTAQTSLTGGVGEGVNVYVNGIAQGVDGAVTDTALPLVVTDLTGAANGDAAVLQVESDGVYSDPITLGVVT